MFKYRLFALNAGSRVRLAWSPPSRVFLQALLVIAVFVGSPTAGWGQTPVMFSSPTYSVVERTQIPFVTGNFVDVTVLRTDGGIGALSVEYRDQEGSAESTTGYEGTDYLETYGTLDWADGDTSPRTISTFIVQDGYFEGDHFFTVELLLGSFPYTVYDTTTVTIVDDDSEIVINGFPMVPERSGSVVLTLERVGIPLGDVAVDYVTSSTRKDIDLDDDPKHAMTAGVDFPVVTGQISWPDGDSAPRTLEVFFNDDCDPESGPDGDWEWFFLNLTAAQGFAYRNVDTYGTFPEQQPIRVDDDDQVPRLLSFGSPSYSFTEGIGTHQLTVTRQGPLYGAAAAEIVMTGGSASSPSDFVLGATSVSWADGDGAPKIVTIDVPLDGSFEGPEDVVLDLVSLTGTCMVPGTSRTTVTLRDADGPPKIDFTKASASVREDSGSLTVGVLRSGSLNGAANVDYVATDGEAVAGDDFVVAPGTLQWSDGQGGVKSFQVEILTDTDFEGTETFTLSLQNPVGATVDAATHVVHIEEITGAPQVNFTSATFEVGERDGEALVQLTLSEPVAVTVEARVEQMGGTATPGADFDFSAAEVTWLPGESGAKAVGLTLYDDVSRESVETIRFEIEDVVNAETGVAAEATVRILDNDFVLEAESQIAGVGGRNPAHDEFRSGGGVVAFTAPDGDGDGVFVQLRSASGVVTATLRVHPTTDGNQSAPDVVVLPDGSFVVAWIDEASAENLLLARRFSQSGQPLGGVAMVKAAPAVSLSRATVSADGNGELLFSWLAESVLEARRYRGLGSPPDPVSVVFATTAVRGECQLNLYGDRFCVHETQESSVLFRIDFRSARTGALSPGPQGEIPAAGEPRIASGPEVFAMTYRDLDQNQDLLAVLDREGAEVGSPREIGSNSAGTIRLAVNSMGEIAVVFEDPSNFEIRARSYSIKGELLTGDVLIASDTSGGNPRLGDVTLSATDKLRVAYERQDPAGGALGIFSQAVALELGGGPCNPMKELCLGKGRFRGEVSFRALVATEDASSVVLTEDSGYHWFFDSDNVETVVKVLDACGVNGAYWVFATGLTDVAVHLRVEDTTNGQGATYFNSGGSAFRPIQDTSAFSGCP